MLLRSDLRRALSRSGPSDLDPQTWTIRLQGPSDLTLDWKMALLSRAGGLLPGVSGKIWHFGQNLIHRILIKYLMETSGF